MTARDSLIALLEEAEGITNNDLPTLEQIAEHLVEHDVIPVVRCNQCKHYRCWADGRAMKQCDIDFRNVYSDDFCSYGERREEDE